MHSTFGEVFKNIWKTVFNVVKGKDYHIISGSYIEQFIKKCERIKRSETNPAEFANLEISSPIPPVMAYSENKELLQLISQEYFVAKSKNN